MDTFRPRVVIAKIKIYLQFVWISSQLKTYRFFYSGKIVVYTVDYCAVNTTAHQSGS